VRAGGLEILEQLGAGPGLPFERLDLPEHHHSSLGHHREGVAEGVHRLRVELAG
jgi:hypothetical protein